MLTVSEIHGMAVADGLGDAAGDVERQVLDQVADADSGDHQRHAGSGAQRLVSHPLNEEAQHHGDDQHQGQSPGKWAWRWWRTPSSDLPP